MPKKVIKCIEAMCRTFLWTGGAELSKKARIARDHLCSPDTAGGLNILNMQTWNRAAVSKFFVELMQEERQAVGTVDTYVLWEARYTLGG